MVLSLPLSFLKHAIVTFHALSKKAASSKYHRVCIACIFVRMSILFLMLIRNQAKVLRKEPALLLIALLL